MTKICTLIFSFLFTLLFAVPAWADEAFDIQDFKTDIQMYENGKMTVTETIDVVFSEKRHGIFRDIQTQGISIEVLSVKDYMGKDRRYERQGFSEGVQLKIGHPDKYVSGEQTYKIAYNVKKAIRFFQDHDELYWNATGNAWPVAIHGATTTVTLPPSAKGIDNLQFKCFTGQVYSGSEDCTYEYDAETNVVTFKADQSLPAYNGLTIVVGMPPNTLERPAGLQILSKPADADVYINEQKTCVTDCFLDYLEPGRYGIELKKFGYKTPEIHTVNLVAGGYAIESFDLKKYFWLDLLTFLLVLLAAAVVLEPVYTFWKNGRDPEGRGSIPPQYDSPDDLSPAEMGTLVDERVHMHDLTAAIVDLCVRGYLKIKVLPDAKGWIFKSDDYELIRLDKPKPGDRGLSTFEKNFIASIFGTKKHKKISSLQNKFYKELPSLKKSLYKSLVEKGYFPKSPNKIRSNHSIKGFVMIFAGFFALMFEGAFFQTNFSLLLVINGFLSLVFSPFMPRKTRKGVLAREHILGFKDYLETAEKHRLQFQEKEHIFYEFLPYAMTLKIADKWSKAFKDIFDKPPEWYEGAGKGQFQPISFVHNLSVVQGCMNNAFSSHPSSSGSGGSGFGGGGFSGGGFGGGGGGSW